MICVASPGCHEDRIQALHGPVGPSYRRNAGPCRGTAAPSAPAGFAITTLAAAPQTMPATTGADDITNLSDDVFVGWQNGVGPKGEPNSTTGQTTSLLVEYSASGRQVGSWALPGKIDGLGSDPAEHRVMRQCQHDRGRCPQRAYGPADPVRHGPFKGERPPVASRADRRKRTTK